MQCTAAAGRWPPQDRLASNERRIGCDATTYAAAVRGEAGPRATRQQVKAGPGRGFGRVNAPRWTRADSRASEMFPRADLSPRALFRLRASHRSRAAERRIRGFLLPFPLGYWLRFPTGALAV
ncbi:hypothetical protein E2562_032827 [Oryza meyeriana var. granulata]|uniref:Uncharacterized protein n=1 Tax=Oryza meyeriana var. granulata TaxID=110450 RepID=A0A6G1DRR7_9ORYZ|nr:hypothetical protein E2562_032827 [Oryza meyeriana var. granulata]